jgi:two-component system, sensor histidine kinase and response regulator
MPTPAEASVTPAPTSAPAAGWHWPANARVLVVDDNLINQTVAAKLLQRQGLQVALANDGSQAVQEVAHTPFNLILMDLQMPVMDGLQATRTIRTLPNGAEVPIVALTANVFEDDRRRCVEAGMNDFLAKPVSPNLLYATLARWMGATPH